jgi:hypothetical protein
MTVLSIDYFPAYPVQLNEVYSLPKSTFSGISESCNSTLHLNIRSNENTLKNHEMQVLMILMESLCAKAIFIDAWKSNNTYFDMIPNSFWSFFNWDNSSRHIDSPIIFQNHILSILTGIRYENPSFEIISRLFTPTVWFNVFIFSTIFSLIFNFYYSQVNILWRIIEIFLNLAFAQKNKLFKFRTKFSIQIVLICLLFGSFIFRRHLKAQLEKTILYMKDRKVMNFCVNKLGIVKYNI